MQSLQNAKKTQAISERQMADTLNIEKMLDNDTDTLNIEKMFAQIKTE